MLSVLLAVYAIYKIYNPLEYLSPRFYFICILFGGISAITVAYSDYYRIDCAGDDLYGVTPFDSFIPAMVILTLNKLD